MQSISSFLQEPATCYKYGNCVCGAGNSVLQNYQPVNIVTSFFLLVLAIYIYSAFKGKKRMLVSRFSILLAIEALSAAFLHWKMSLFAQIFDYTFVTILIIYGEVYLKWRKFSDIPLFFLTLLIFALEILLPDLRFLIAGVPLFIYAYMNIIARKRVKKFTPMLVLFILGFLVWQLGEGSFGCNPNSILQFHSVWHVIVCIVGYLNIKYYMDLDKKSL